MGNQKNRRAVEKPLSPRELSAFCAQLAMLVRSGIPAAEAISIMRGDAGGGPGGELLAAIGERLEDRAALGTALAEAGVFPRYFVSMVEIGERSGRLDEVLDALCAYYEREESVSEGIRSAVAYPLVMIVMMALVVGVLVIKVLPVFSEVFVELGGGASSFAGQVMRLGAASGRIAIALTAVVLLLLAAYLLMRAFPAGRAALSRWSAVFPLTRGISARVASGRFASAMAMMLSSGLDSDQSLDMAVRLLDEGPMRRRAERCRELVSAGPPLPTRSARRASSPASTRGWCRSAFRPAPPTWCCASSPPATRRRSTRGSRGCSRCSSPPSSPSSPSWWGSSCCRSCCP